MISPTLSPEPLWARLVVALTGLFYVLAGAALLWATPWFFENIGPFPPYNRHYAGDAGAFSLPLGIGLLWAARSLRRHRPLIVITLIAGLLHSLNHGYDHLQDGASLSHWLTDFAPLALSTALLALTLAAVRPRSVSPAPPPRSDPASPLPA